MHLVELDATRWIRFAGRVDLTILILASPAFYFPNQLPPFLAALGLAAGLAAWLAGSLTTRAAFRDSPFDLSLSLLLSMLIPSLYASADWTQSLPNLTRIALGAMLFSTLGRRLRTQRQWTRTYWRVVPAASVGLAGLFLLGIQWIGKFEWLAPVYALLPRLLDAVPHYAEIKGFHPNPVAGVLLFFVPVLLAIAFAGSQEVADADEQNRTRNLWSLLAGADAGIRLDSLIRFGAPFLVIGLVILTQSRSALLGLALAFVRLASLSIPNPAPFHLAPNGGLRGRVDPYRRRSSAHDPPGRSGRRVHR